MEPQYIYIVVPMGHMVPCATFTSRPTLIDYLKQEFKMYSPYIYRFRDGAQHPQDNFVYHGLKELLD